ncbi:MAG: hypothetical protein ACKVIR_01610 [Candidatus Poseidoniales archaeon]
MPTKEFSCRRVKFPKPIVDEKGFVANWLKIRPSDSWVLLSGGVLAGEIHGLVAIEILNRNKSRNQMKSTGVDGEFMRLIAGTHHVSQAFSRVGMAVGDVEAWLIDLTQNNVSKIPSICAAMGFEQLLLRPSLALFDPLKLGLDETADENDAIGLIHLSDIK